MAFVLFLQPSSIKQYFSGENEAVQLFTFVFTDSQSLHTFGYCRFTPRTNSCLCILRWFCFNKIDSKYFCLVAISGSICSTIYWTIFQLFSLMLRFVNLYFNRLLKFISLFIQTLINSFLMLNLCWQMHITWTFRHRDQNWNWMHALQLQY